MNTAYKTVLVALPPMTHEWYGRPVDAIRRAAATLGSAPGVRLVFISVFSLEQELGTGQVNLLPPEDLEQIVLFHERKHRDGMNAYLKWFADNGVEHEVIVLQGDPADVILHTARERGADLILMGHHHKTGLLNIFGSDITARVSKHLPCDLMVITPGEE
ncbi:MAG: universal stress protein [Nitrospinae bacterium]|nr:universal stress protein [Nitrospinota bacterium]